MLLLAEDSWTNRVQLLSSLLPLLLDISFSFLWYPRTSAVLCPGFFRDVHTLAVPCPTYKGPSSNWSQLFDNSIQAHTWQSSNSFAKASTLMPETDQLECLFNFWIAKNV